MAIKVNSAATEGYFQNNNFGKPDMTQDFSAFIQFKQNVDLTGKYQQIVTFFTNNTTDYSDPYFGIFADHANGIYLLDSNNDFTTPFFPSLTTYYGLGLTYDHTTHDFEFFVDGISQGTINQDFSATPITEILVGYDTSGDPNLVAGQSNCYYRSWVGVKLSGADFILEAASNKAVTHSAELKYDTSLELNTDLPNKVLSVGGSWQSNPGGSSTGSNDLPGPLGAGGMKLALAPESSIILYYNSNDVLYAITDAVVSESTVTLCPALDGSVWVLYWDNLTTPTVSKLRNINPDDGSINSTITTAVVVGSKSAYKCLAELPDGNILINKHSDGTLLAINKTTGAIAHTYSLTSTPLDCTPNVDVTVLYYTGGNILKAWDLTNDIALPDVKDFGFPVVWPQFLTDNTILVFTGTYLQDGDILRVTTTGNIIQTYTYDHSTFSEGLYNITGSVRDNKLWLAGDWDQVGNEIPAFLIANLTTGVFGDVIPLQELDSDNDDGAGFITNLAIEPAISDLVVNCSNKNITITGTNFPDSPVITLTLNGSPIAFTIVFATTEQIVVNVPTFVNGNYCAQVA
jgi:hypothetical protein